MEKAFQEMAHILHCSYNGFYTEKEKNRRVYDWYEKYVEEVFEPFKGSGRAHQVVSFKLKEE